jgi:uncharacterized membrane protein
MTVEAVIVFLSRWVHVMSACLLAGATFYFAILLPGGTRSLDPEWREAVVLKSRRGFKLLVHPLILLLLASGTYNAIHNWPAYRNNMPTTHALFGPHLLLGLIIFAILLVVLARREPGRSHRAWLRLTVVLLFVTVAVASALKQAREYRRPAQAVAASHTP